MTFPGSWESKIRFLGADEGDNLVAKFRLPIFLVKVEDLAVSLATPKH